MMKLEKQFSIAIKESSRTDIKNENKILKPSREEAENAVRTLIEWAGDDPLREGLKNTPSRVVKSFEEFFSGYNQNAENILSTTFAETSGYDDMIILRDIDFESHCEHHMVPIIGKATIAYIPVKKIVGISKLARTLDIFAKRLQTQENMTAQIGNTIQKILKPKGVAVLVESSHHCMTTRGVQKKNSNMVTTFFTGIFKKEINFKNRFFEQIKL